MQKLMSVKLWVSREGKSLSEIILKDGCKLLRSAHFITHNRKSIYGALVKYKTCTAGFEPRITEHPYKMLVSPEILNAEEMPEINSENYEKTEFLQATLTYYAFPLYSSWDCRFVLLTPPQGDTPALCIGGICKRMGGRTDATVVSGFETVDKLPSAAKIPYATQLSRLQDFLQGDEKLEGSSTLMYNGKNYIFNHYYVGKELMYLESSNNIRLYPADL